MDANTLLLFVGMLTGIFVYWKKGGNQASAEVLAMYKARDELNDKEREDMKNRIHVLTGDVGKLRGIIEEKNKRIDLLESIVQGRNPEMLKFMQDLTKSARESEDFMKSFKDVPQILGEIKTFMHSINTHMETQHA